MPWLRKRGALPPSPLHALKAYTQKIVFCSSPVEIFYIVITVSRTVDQITFEYLLMQEDSEYRCPRIEWELVTTTEEVELLGRLTKSVSDTLWKVITICRNKATLNTDQREIRLSFSTDRLLDRLDRNAQGRRRKHMLDFP